MSFLDLYQGDQDQAAKIQPNEGHDLPSGFSENFNAAWSDGRLFSQSIARDNARAGVLSDYVDEIRQKTGNDLGQDFSAGPYGVTDFDTANARVAKLKADYPDLDLNPLSEDEIDKRAAAKAAAAHRTYANLEAGEKTAGGSFGSFLGSSASAATDPVNLVALAVAPETGGVGILSAALRWGALAGVSQAAIEAASDTFKEQVQPGYMESGGPVKEIGGAFVGGVVLGGSIKALGNAWTRVKTGSWPTSVRDAGNVIESEANVASSNPFPGVEGEVNHRAALSDATDAILTGKPVDVSAHITPEMQAHFDAYHGSPHDFDAFDTSKIGTGEGAQAFGHGLYFAENQRVAAGYQQTLGRDPDAFRVNGSVVEKPSAEYAAAAVMHRMDMSAADAAKHLGDLDATKDIKAVLERWSEKPPEITPGRGNIYQVRITADKDRMLDWDKPLSEQNAYVQTIIKNLLPHVEKSDFISGSGEQLYKELGTVLKIRGLEGGKAGASKGLADAGIPGIKYLDQGSRAGGEGTRNFVVFDDKNVEIAHKNGKPVNAEIRQGAIDQAAGLPPKQPELPLAPDTEPMAPKRVIEPGPAPILQTADEMQKTLTAPDHQDAIRADIDRERAMGDFKVPHTDENGNHSMVSVDAAVDEVDAYKKLADDIQACAAPAAEAAE